jgi:hypothetical protein
MLNSDETQVDNQLTPITSSLRWSPPSAESAMRFKTANIDSLLGRARRAQDRYQAQAAQLNELLEVALDAEASGRPVPSLVVRQLLAIVETDEKLFGRSALRLKRQSLFSKRKTQPPKMAAKRRKRAKTPR